MRIGLCADIELTDLSVYWLIQTVLRQSHQLIFTMVGEMTDADNGMNPIHFESDPADIRIRINSKIRIRIPDQISALAKFALSECSCFDNVCVCVCNCTVL